MITTRTLGDRTATFTIRDGRDDYTLVEVWDAKFYEWDPADLHRATVLDLGANIGAFAVWAATAGALRVRAVEPEPGNYELLARNARTNTGGTVETLRAAAAPGPVKVHRADIPSGSWTDDGDGGEPVKHRTLDDLMEGLGQNVYVKCDIEGGEYDLFDAAGDDTVARIAHLVMEYHAPEPGSHRHLTWTPQRWEAMVARLARTHDIRTNGGETHRGGLLWADRR